ncbi:MAG: hypothetical protein JWR50_1317 [Mucilaginibacter sp.]|nr:hypothetical protein [Mucilaginibacter sp.]
MRLLRYTVLINIAKRITIRLKRLTPCANLVQGVKIEKEFKILLFSIFRTYKRKSP